MKTHKTQNILTAFLAFAAIVITLSFPVSAQDESPIYIHGFISQGYIDSSSNNFMFDTEGGSFQFGEIGLNFTKQVNDKLRIATQLMMKNFGDQQDESVEIDWAFGDYRINDNLGFRAGRIKTPYGLYNQYWDMDFLRTSILLPTGVYGEENRSIINSWDAISVYGTLFSDRPNSLDYEITYGSTDAPVDEIPRFIGLKRNPMISNLEVDNPTNFMAKLTWNTKVEGLRLGYTNIRTDVDIDFTMTPAPGTSFAVHQDLDAFGDLGFIEFVNDKFKIAGEYFRYDMLFTDLATNAKTVNDWDTWYTMVEYTIDEKFNLGAYYSEYHPNRYDKDGKLLAATPGRNDYEAWLKDTCLTLKYNVEENWNIKAEVHFMDGAAKLNPWQNPNGFDKDWTLYVLKTTFNF